MSEELFSVPEAKSPRLKWMEKHCVNVRSTPVGLVGTEDELTGDEVRAFYATGDGTLTGKFGTTEDDALAAWARARGVRLWNEEGYKP